MVSELVNFSSMWQIPQSNRFISEVLVQGQLNPVHRRQGRLSRCREHLIDTAYITVSKSRGEAGAQRVFSRAHLSDLLPSFLSTTIRPQQIKTFQFRIKAILNRLEYFKILKGRKKREIQCRHYQKVGSREGKGFETYHSTLIIFSFSSRVQSESVGPLVLQQLELSSLLNIVPRYLRSLSPTPVLNLWLL